MYDKLLVCRASGFNYAVTSFVLFRVTSWIVWFSVLERRSTKSREITRIRKHLLCELSVTFEAKPVVTRIIKPSHDKLTVCRTSKGEG
jgi:hypothetical protein